MLKRITPVLFAGAISALAARPVATITSPSEFTLSGVRISAPTVSSWPLTVGDEIKDLAAPAVIRFADSTQIAVGKGSSLTLGSENGRTTVRLTSGSMTYRLGNNSNIRVFALDHEVDKSQDDLSINGSNVNHGNHTGSQFDAPAPPPAKLPGRSQGE